VYAGVQEALISASLFEQVQLVRAGKSGKKVTTHSHTYRGLFSCKNCNKAMVPEKQKGLIYYRCHTPACGTNTIREEHLEQSIVNILRRVEISDEAEKFLIPQITEWIERRTTTTTPSPYIMQLEQINLRLERLTDALIDRVIDNDDFNTRKQTLFLERVAVQEKLDLDAKRISNPNHLQKFLELVKSLYSTYIIATKEEKRQIVQMTTSNRTVFGKQVFVEPSNWLRDAQTALGVLLCAHDAPTSRSSPDMLDKQFERLVEIAEEITVEKMKQERAGV
jgi:site-specific DNA recombinase